MSRVRVGALRAGGDGNDDFRTTSRPITSGKYPAKEHCSQCGLCDTYYVHFVRDACAFLAPGDDIRELERVVHGRARALDDEDELVFGVTQSLLNARVVPSVPGAQWTGIVTSIACTMLSQGLVDAVVCVQSDAEDRFTPKPFVARSVEDIVAARGVKPCLSPNLDVLATVEALDVRRLLFIGVGCQVRALRTIQPYLAVDELYVLGTNCTDNGTREGLEKFLNLASSHPVDAIRGYEFMQDYRVHFKLHDGTYEKVPYFSLPANELTDVIAPSCMSCFLYPNDLADLVVGYMGAPYDDSTQMDQHYQSVIVRNDTGQKMLDVLRQHPAHRVETAPPVSRKGLLKRESLVMQTVQADDAAKRGEGPEGNPPRFVAELLAWLLTRLGPQGVEFAKYSIEYHYLRNYIHVMRHWKQEQGERHVPEYVKRLNERYGNIVKDYADLPADPWW
jgi:7-hydroxymethyl chlorophyll a reductase